MPPTIANTYVSTKNSRRENKLKLDSFGGKSLKAYKFEGNKQVIRGGVEKYRII